MDVFVNHKVRYLSNLPQLIKIRIPTTIPVQRMASFGQIIQEESDTKVREHVLDYVIDLSDDATNFS